MKLFALFLLAPIPALSQATFPTPIITSFSPLGGQPGQTVEITFKGSDLDGLRGVHLSPDPGAPVVAGPKLDANRKPLANTLSVMLPKGASPGMYDLRVSGDFGISNPRVFQIGAQPVAKSTGSNDKPDRAVKIKLDTALHGAFQSAAPHWFEFSGKAGQRVFAAFDGAAFAVRTRLTGSLHQADGREAARLRDGWLAATLPADGIYRLKVHDLMHGTGDDFGYRITLTTGPVVHCSHHTPGDAFTTLHGWNLPGSETLPSLQVRPGPPLERLVTDTKTAAQLIAASPLPVFRFDGETEPASAANGQPAALSIGQAYSGWFPAHGSARVLDLAFKNGDRLVIEVISALQGQPTDPHLLIENLKKDTAGAETLTPQAEVNDMPALSPAPSVARVPLLDPAYAFEAKADGAFRISVSDPLNSANGRRHPFILRVRSLDDPDTGASIAMHATLPRTAAVGPHEIGSANVWRGGIGVIEVALPQRTALSSPREWSLSHPGPGISFLGGFAGKGQRSAFLAFHAADTAPASPVLLTGLTDSLYLDWNVRDTNREFLFTHSSGTPMLGIVEQPAPARVEAESIIELQAGEKAEMHLKIHRHSDFTETLLIKALGLGDAAKAPAVTIPAKAIESKFVLDTKSLGLSPGEYGFILQGAAKMPLRRNALQLANAKKKVQLCAAELSAALKAQADALAALKNIPAEMPEPKADAQIKFKAVSDKVAAAEKSSAEAKAFVKELEAKNPPKDATFVIYSNPIRLFVRQPGK